MIELSLYSAAANDAQGMYAYDATEWPSHLRFNTTTDLGPYTEIEPTI